MNLPPGGALTSPVPEPAPCLNILVDLIRTVYATSVDTLNGTMQIIERNLGLPPEVPCSPKSVSETKNRDLVDSIALLRQTNLNIEKIGYSIRQLQEG